MGNLQFTANLQISHLSPAQPISILYLTTCLHGAHVYRAGSQGRLEFSCTPEAIRKHVCWSQPSALGNKDHFKHGYFVAGPLEPIKTELVPLRSLQMKILNETTAETQGSVKAPGIPNMLTASPFHRISPVHRAEGGDSGKSSGWEFGWLLYHGKTCLQIG